MTLLYDEPDMELEPDVEAEPEPEPEEEQPKPVRKPSLFDRDAEIAAVNRALAKGGVVEFDCNKRIWYVIGVQPLTLYPDEYRENIEVLVDGVESGFFTWTDQGLWRYVLRTLGIPRILKSLQQPEAEAQPEVPQAEVVESPVHVVRYGVKIAGEQAICDMIVNDEESREELWREQFVWEGQTNPVEAAYDTMVAAVLGVQTYCTHHGIPVESVILKIRSAQETAIKQAREDVPTSVPQRHTQLREVLATFKEAHLYFHRPAGK